ncbi:MAG: type II toxin-antitoxin system Phd/YefM family antitoxin [Flammeovirgaceae bacterium]
MQYVSATDAKQSFGATIEKAQREPVIIRRQNRDIAVILSAQDYERMQRFNIEDFQQFRQRMGAYAKSQGLTEAKLKAILASPH